MIVNILSVYKEEMSIFFSWYTTLMGISSFSAFKISEIDSLFLNDKL